MTKKAQQPEPVSVDSNEGESLQLQIEAIQKELEEAKSKYLRMLADYQNLEKRSRSEKEDIRLYAGATVLGKLLPIVDTFDRAQAHLKDPGLGIALKELYAFLTQQGVEKLSVEGVEFNPHEMECVEVVVDPKKDNIVLEEVSPGFRIHGKLLRPARVKVGKNIHHESDNLIQNKN